MLHCTLYQNLLHPCYNTLCFAFIQVPGYIFLGMLAYRYRQPRGEDTLFYVYQYLHCIASFLVPVQLSVTCNFLVHACGMNEASLYALFLKLPWAVCYVEGERRKKEVIRRAKGQDFNFKLWGCWTPLFILLLQLCNNIWWQSYHQRYAYGPQ